MTTGAKLALPLSSSDVFLIKTGSARLTLTEAELCNRWFSCPPVPSMNRRFRRRNTPCDKHIRLPLLSGRSA